MVPTKLLRPIPLGEGMLGSSVARFPSQDHPTMEVYRKRMFIHMIVFPNSTDCHANTLDDPIPQQTRNRILSEVRGACGQKEGPPLIPLTFAEPLAGVDSPGCSGLPRIHSLSPIFRLTTLLFARWSCPSQLSRTNAYYLFSPDSMIQTPPPSLKVQQLSKHSGQSLHCNASAARLKVSRGAPGC